MLRTRLSSFIVNETITSFQNRNDRFELQVLQPLTFHLSRPAMDHRCERLLLGEVPIFF